MRPEWRAGDAVTIVVRRVDARIEREALLDQYVERPQVAARDRETGGAVCRHGFASKVFQQDASTAHVGPKFVGRLLVNQAMPVAVTGNFVAGGVDGTHQFRLAVGDPAQYEERGPDASVFENLQNLVRPDAHARLVSVPLRSVHAVLERGNLVEVFHVDRQGVERGWRGGRRRGRRRGPFQDGRHHRSFSVLVAASASGGGDWRASGKRRAGKGRGRNRGVPGESRRPLRNESRRRRAAASPTAEANERRWRG